MAAATGRRRRRTVRRRAPTVPPRHRLRAAARVPARTLQRPPSSFIPCSTWSRRSDSCRCPRVTTKRPTIHGVAQLRAARRCRPLSTNSGSSSASVTATPTGANTHSVQGPPQGSSLDPSRRPASPQTQSRQSMLLLVGQLARVFDQEARAAHELVGLLGQHPLVALGLVLLVGRLLVLGLVLDDQALLEDHVQTGLDVLVVGLLFLFLVVALAGLLDHRGRRGVRTSTSSSSSSSSTSTTTSVVLVVGCQDVFVVDILQVVVVEVELLVETRLRGLGALGLDFFGSWPSSWSPCCRRSIDGRATFRSLLQGCDRAGGPWGLWRHLAGPDQPGKQHVLYSTPRAYHRLSQHIPPLPHQRFFFCGV